MQNTINLLLQRKISCAVSLIILLLIVALVVESGIESRWAVLFSGASPFLMAFILWLVWIVHFIWLLSKQPRVLKIWKANLVAVVFGILMFFVAGKIAQHFVTIALEHDVQPALNAGLYRDCVQLMQTWPTNQDRIYFSDTNFASLPSSIKMLKPVYVESSTYDKPSNIGICKNGFGGFAMGVRVFRSDDDAMKFSTNTVGRYIRLTSGIYIWWHPT